MDPRFIPIVIFCAVSVSLMLAGLGWVLWAQRRNRAAWVRKIERAEKPEQ